MHWPRKYSTDAAKAYRWRYGFAILPKRIGASMIWLERYRWRVLPEAESGIPWRRDRSMAFKWVEEFESASGITGRRLATWFSFYWTGPSYKWDEPGIGISHDKTARG